MLRGLVVLALLVNVALFFWLRSETAFGQGDREPERLRRQVAPQAILVLPEPPDLPASAASAAPASLAPLAGEDASAVGLAPDGGGQAVLAGSAASTAALPVRGGAASGAAGHVTAAHPPAARPSTPARRPAGI